MHWGDAEAEKNLIHTTQAQELPACYSISGSLKMQKLNSDGKPLTAIFLSISETNIFDELTDELTVAAER